MAVTELEYDVDELPGLATRLGRRIASDLAARGAVAWSIAIPGGSVATRLLPLLARESLPWRRCEVLFVDERHVAADDAASNWRTCRDATADTPMTEARWHRLHGEIAIDDAATQYARTVRAIAGAPPVIDVALLGVGEDGHVASLFPHRVHEPGRAVVVERHAPKPPAMRVSLSFEVLTAARLTCVVALGEGKREVVRVARERSSPSPVARVLRDAAAPWLLVDHAAAGLAPSPG
ncbi:MAG: 6-phosphogluconolactonase [Vicinamibacterales bacterium]